MDLERVKKFCFYLCLFFLYLTLSSQTAVPECLHRLTYPSSRRLDPQHHVMLGSGVGARKECSDSISMLMST
jgi:hypothetical protein